MSRLPVYLRALTVLTERGVRTVASEELAVLAGVGPAMLRKDLSLLGRHGTRGVGYDVGCLVTEISRALGVTQAYGVVIVGVGHLGQALASYAGFTGRGFAVRALVDCDRTRVGEVVAGLRVRHLDELEAVVAECGVTIGVLATPAAAAQEVCDRLVGAGVTGILNFAPVRLLAPELVELRTVDLSLELQVLAFYEQRKQSADGAEAVRS